MCASLHHGTHVCSVPSAVQLLPLPCSGQSAAVVLSGSQLWAPAAHDLLLCQHAEDLLQLKAAQSREAVWHPLDCRLLCTWPFGRVGSVTACGGGAVCCMGATVVAAACVHSCSCTPTRSCWQRAQATAVATVSQEMTAQTQKTSWHNISPTSTMTHVGMVTRFLAPCRQQHQATASTVVCCQPGQTACDTLRYPCSAHPSHPHPAHTVLVMPCTDQEQYGNQLTCTLLDGPGCQCRGVDGDHLDGCCCQHLPCRRSGVHVLPPPTHHASAPVPVSTHIKTHSSQSLETECC